MRKFCYSTTQNRYLSEIAESNRHYDETALTSSSKLYGVFKTIETVSKFPLSQNQELMMPLYCQLLLNQKEGGRR
jgi:hypothetical protein